MRYKVNYDLKNDYIVAYYIIPFDAKLPTIEVEESDFKYLKTQKCKLVNGVLDKSEATKYIQEAADKTALQAELRTLMAWFNKYDEESLQYQRQLRLKMTPTIDIMTLDKQAEINRARIIELRQILDK